MTPNLLTDRSSVDGCRFVENFKFSNGVVAPLYEVEMMAAFNQLIGHAKFVNAQYGNVYYRGVNALYDNVLPSIMRGRKYGDAKGLSELLNKICNDDYFHDSIKLRDESCIRGNPHLKQIIHRKNRYCVEGLLQHYAGSTRFIDVVDNHWVALWMGLHSFIKTGYGLKYCKCEKRELSLGAICQSLEGDSIHILPKPITDDIYEYILLLAMPYAEKNPQCGIIETEEFVEVDLRKTLPSFYLRPHAQHALVIRRRDKSQEGCKPLAAHYDMATQVVAILRVRIDRASLWIGNGNLLSATNLFPSPSIDQGYNNLLMHSDMFVSPFEIIKYY